MRYWKSFRLNQVDTPDNKDICQNSEPRITRQTGILCTIDRGSLPFDFEIWWHTAASAIIVALHNEKHIRRKCAKTLVPLLEASVQTDEYHAPMHEDDNALPHKLYAMRLNREICYLTNLRNKWTKDIVQCEFECATIIQNSKEMARNISSRAKSYKHEIENKKAHIGVLLDTPIRKHMNRVVQEEYLQMIQKLDTDVKLKLAATRTKYLFGGMPYQLDVNDIDMELSKLQRFDISSVVQNYNVQRSHAHLSQLQHVREECEALLLRGILFE